MKKGKDNMLPMVFQRLIHDIQEKRKIVREARIKIGELIGNNPVIELGCGFGPNSNYCKGPYFGIDIRPNAIQEAKRRYPTRNFLCGDITTVKEKASDYNTILFSAVLHEIPDYVDVLYSVTHTNIRRILICDYDPELGGWLRLWMKLFKPDSKKWWGSRPALLIPGPDWSLQKGQITRSFLWWEYKRR